MKLYCNHLKCKRLQDDKCICNKENILLQRDKNYQLYIMNIWIPLIEIYCNNYKKHIILNKVLDN